MTASVPNRSVGAPVTVTGSETVTVNTSLLAAMYVLEAGRPKPTTAGTVSIRTPLVSTAGSARGMSALEESCSVEPAVSDSPTTRTPLESLSPDCTT